MRQTIEPAAAAADEAALIREPKIRFADLQQAADDLIAQANALIQEASGLKRRNIFASAYIAIAKRGGATGKNKSHTEAMIKQVQDCLQAYEVSEELSIPQAKAALIQAISQLARAIRTQDRALVEKRRRLNRSTRKITVALDADTSSGGGGGGGGLAVVSEEPGSPIGVPTLVNDSSVAISLGLTKGVRVVSLPIAGGAVAAFEKFSPQRPHLVWNELDILYQLGLKSCNHIGDLYGIRYKDRVPHLYLKLERQDLHQFIYAQQGAAHPLQTPIYFYRDMTAGIAYMHALGIVHGDLKPANFVIGNDGRIKIIDFGFAQRVDKHGRVTIRSGTTQFVSPEQFIQRAHAKTKRRSSLPVGTAADIWSLGVTFSMLAVSMTNPYAVDRVVRYLTSVLHYPSKLLALKSIGLGDVFNYGIEVTADTPILKLGQRVPLLLPLLLHCVHPGKRFGAPLQCLEEKMPESNVHSCVGLFNAMWQLDADRRPTAARVLRALPADDSAEMLGVVLDATNGGAAADDVFENPDLCVTRSFGQ